MRFSSFCVCATTPRSPAGFLQLRYGAMLRLPFTFPELPSTDSPESRQVAASTGAPEIVGDFGALHPAPPPQLTGGGQPHPVVCCRSGKPRGDSSRMAGPRFWAGARIAWNGSDRPQAPRTFHCGEQFVCQNGDRPGGPTGTARFFPLMRGGDRRPKHRGDMRKVAGGRGLLRPIPKRLARFLLGSPSEPSVASKMAAAEAGSAQRFDWASFSHRAGCAWCGAGRWGPVRARRLLGRILSTRFCG